MSASSATRAWSRSDGLFRDQRLAEIGVVHGMTTRLLGDMKETARVAAALAGSGVGEGQTQSPLFLTQVHGAAIIRAQAGADSKLRPPADGWVTDAPALALCIYIADCVPLFIAEKAGKAAGIFHAGWRGAAARMPAAAAASFRAHFDIGPGRLIAALGPHIGPCCYRVGEDVAERFPASVVRREGGLFLDLGGAVRRQLTDAGIAPEDIADSPACTHCETELFYSYRREKGVGRMMAFVSIADGH